MDTHSGIFYLENKSIFIKSKHIKMKTIKTLFFVLLIGTIAACNQPTEKQTTAPAEIIIKDEKPKVKVKFDGDNKELNIETDKVDIELK